MTNELNDQNNVGEIEKELNECKAKCAEYLEGWKRERAGFLNYKKEEMERISGLARYAQEEMILKFLPILDNFYLAEREMGDDLKNHSWSAGFLNIQKQIEEFLKTQGVEETKVEKGDVFNPSTMEAIEGEEETVSEVAQKGYTMNGKLLRPAKVKVSK